MNDEEIAEVKTEAFRSLAKTLTNLLEKLDEVERDSQAATQQLEEEEKLASHWSKRLLSSKRLKDKEAEKRLNVWRKLVEGLDEEDQSETTDATERKPFGKIQVKRGDAAKIQGKDEGVKVRVSTIKKKDQADSADETETTSETAKLERRIAEKLKDAGFDTQGKPLRFFYIFLLKHKFIFQVDLCK